MLFDSTNVRIHLADCHGPVQDSMKHLTSKLLFAAGWFLTAASLAAAGAPEKQAENAAYIGQPVCLVVQPETIRLAGARAMRQILVTGRYSDGSERE